MADDVLAEKVFNFTCGSGGFAELSFLLKDSSPLKNITTEQEKKNWLKTKARGRFVLVKDDNDEIAGVRIDLRKKICQQYLSSGSCPRTQGKCKFWHICKSFIEGNCDWKCSRSHDFFDPDNKGKTSELGIEKHSNGTVRNIVAWSLPQVCKLYLSNECKSDKCPYLHVCSKVVRGSPCNCALSHNITDSHNKKILKQYDLVPHQSMRIAFVRSSILVLEEQRTFGKCERSISAGAIKIKRGSSAPVKNSADHITPTTAQPLAKKPSLPKQGTNDAQIKGGETSQATASNITRGSKQIKRENNLLSETGNTRKQQKLEMTKCQQTETKDQDSVINNLASVSTATTSCKKSLEFLNIQAEEDENCSDSSSEENKTTSESFRLLKGNNEKNTHALPEEKGQLAYHVTSTSSPICLSGAKSSCYELNSDGTCESEEKKSLVNSCGKTDDPPAFRAQSNGDKLKRPSVVAPSGLPASDVSKDFVKKWVMGSDETEQTSGVKESHSMDALPKVVEAERRQRKLSVSSSCSSLPDPQKCTPSKKAVFDCILEEYNGTVSFDAISSRQDLFPVGCGDVAAWFKARKDSFLLRESKEGQVLEVSSFCRRAQLCFRQQACSAKNCQYLHVCRDYIAGFCRFGDRCQRNHSFQYDEDRKLLSKLRLNGLSKSNLCKVIQRSIPQVCLDYNEGNCTRDQNCGRIHICKDMIKKKCEDEKDCGFQHEKALLTPHATAILENYGLKIRDGNTNPVLRVLLVCEEKPTRRSNYCRETMVLAENISVSARANVGKETFWSVPAPLKNGSAISCEPSEQKVFECLCKEYDCSVSFSVIAKRTDLFPNEFNDIESWFRRKKGSFRLTENDRGIIVQVDAFSAKARLCFSYNNVSGTCKKESCSYLHVCRDYVTDSCCDGATCVRNHQFQNEKDKALLSRIKLDQLTNKQLCRLVLSSAPQVCVEYNHGICDRGEGCPKIHMCTYHLKKCHGEGYDCELDHESAMTCDHTQGILERYHMEHLKSDVVKRIVLVYDDSIRIKDTGHVHRNKPDTPICSDFILSKCKKGYKCPGHHCSLPFHWQYKLPDDEWMSFSETENEKLEKLYCDVSLENCSATGFQISLESDGFLLLDDGYDVNFLLDNKLMIIQKDLDVIANIRRLSSESYASNPGNAVATAWTWYWQNESGIWLEYDVDHLDRDLQKSIEEAFLSKSKCCSFRISGQDYRLYFCSETEMYQENVRYGTRKEVRRRPADFRSRADIQQLKRSHKSASANQKAGKNLTSANVPSQWSSMPSDKQYKRVPLTSTSSEYKEMEMLFKKTIKNTVVIKSIERVQNQFMWEKYQRKKENMLTVKTVGQKRIFLNEKRLFHGTSPETVEAICKQNFDWRLHGKNATMYGEGSYFALNASYSDAYAKEDANSCRFMFVARVLVGSYTEGHSSYRRPPQKNPSNPASDLYDSCVDDKSNPTIFVVFDTDQFYPEYIIKYSHESAWYSIAYQAAHGGYQQPGAKKPVPKPKLPKALPLQSGASQSHATRTAAMSRSSSTPGTSIYSSTSGKSAGYSLGLNVTGVSSYITTSGSNSGPSSGLNTSSTSNAANTRHQSTTTRSHTGALNSYHSSSASGTSSTPYQSATSGSSSGSSSGNMTSSTSNSASTQHQSTATKSHAGASNSNYSSSATGTSSTPYQSATSGSNSGSSSGYDSSSTSNAASTQHQSTATKSHTGASISDYSSSASGTSSTPYQSATSGTTSGSSSDNKTSSTSNAASTRHQGTATKFHSGASISYYSSSHPGTSSTPYQSATSGSSSVSSSGYNASSDSKAASTQRQSTATKSNSGASNTYYSSSASGTSSTPYRRATSGSNSGSSSGYNASSDSKAASSRNQSTAIRSHSVASNNYYYSSASNTCSTTYQSATSGVYSGTSSGHYTSSPSSTSSTRFQDTPSRSKPYGPSTQSGIGAPQKKYRSSKDKTKCSVM